MLVRCEFCPVLADRVCMYFQYVCDRMPDSEFRARWVEANASDQEKFPSVSDFQSTALAQSEADPWSERILACEDFNPGCCANPAAYCTRFNRTTTRAQCIACLSGQGDG